MKTFIERLFGECIGMTKFGYQYETDARVHVTPVLISIQ